VNSAAPVGFSRLKSPECATPVAKERAETSLLIAVRSYDFENFGILQAAFNGISWFFPIHTIPKHYTKPTFNSI
jgi:hypothetical protein